MSNALPRRRFLTLGTGATALLAAAGTGLAWWSAGYARLLSPGDRPIALTTKEFAIVKALIRALLPADGDLPAGEALALAQRVDEEVWAADPAVRDDLAWGLQLLEHLPRFYGARGRLTELAPDAARAYFERVLLGDRETPRQVAIAVRQLLHLLYYAQPETWSAIGYGGPLVARAVPPATHERYRGIWRAS